MRVLGAVPRIATWALLCSTSAIQAQTTTTNCQLYPGSVSCTTMPSGAGNWLGVAGALFEGYGRDQERRRLDAAYAQDRELTAAALTAVRAASSRQSVLDAADEERRDAALRLFIRRANLVRRKMADSLVLFDEAFAVFTDSSSAVLSDLFLVDPSAPISRIEEELRPVAALFIERHTAFMSEAAEVGQTLRRQPAMSAPEAELLLKASTDVRTARLAGRDSPLRPVVDSLVSVFKENREACARGTASCNAALVAGRRP